jgi:hypothetical protein
MPQAVFIWHSGALTVQSVASLCDASADAIATSFQGTYTASQDLRLTVVGATSGSPFVVPMGSVATARAVLIRVVNGASITAVITSAAGTSKINVSSLFLWSSPNPGDEITAISLVGTADVRVLIAGDVS